MTSTDLTIDEQSSVDITVYPTYSDGSPVNLTNATITWVASFNGIQQVKKDTDQMTIMIGPAMAQYTGGVYVYPTVAATANPDQPVIRFSRISGFGSDAYRRVVTDLIVGNIVSIVNNAGQEEYCTVKSINETTLDITMTSDLVYIHQSGNIIKRIIPQFIFRLLPGDTILPVTKIYGSPLIWEHMAQATFPEGLSPGNIYQEPTTLVLLRGRLYIYPILDII
jgi:hypothetical protein